jgi:hypothetical protein
MVGEVKEKFEIVIREEDEGIIGEGKEMWV